MRIAIFSDNLYPEISGISDSIITTAKQLAKRGHKIDIYAPRYTKKDFDCVGLPFKEIGLGENIKVIRFSALPFQSGTGQGKFVIPIGRAVYYLSKNRPDVIHIQHFMGTCIEGKIAARILKIPLVGTDHTFASDYARIGPFEPEWLKRFANWYNTRFFKKCNFLSAPSEALLAGYKYKLSMPHEVISNPLDMDNFYKFNKPFKKNTKDFNVCFSGSLTPTKKVDLIIRAIAKLKEKEYPINFLITGEGESEKDLKQLVVNLGVKENVKFLGFASGKRLWDFYKSGDVYVVMRRENQSTAAMKAMVCGLPVITVKSGGTKEFVNSKNGFVIEDEDVDALVNKLTFLYKNPTIKNKLGNQAKKDSERFKPENIAAIWERVYKGVIGKY